MVLESGITKSGKFTIPPVIGGIKISLFLPIILRSVEQHPMSTYFPGLRSGAFNARACPCL
jgi:hypothetical protein